MTTPSFVDVWQTLHQLEDKVVRTLVQKRPNLIMSFRPEGMARRSCRPKSQGGNWETPTVGDWQALQVVPIADFQRFWDLLARKGHSEVPKDVMQIVPACYAAIPELGVEKIKDRPLTLKLKTASEVITQTITDVEDTEEFGELERIVVDPDICSGKPTIKGTRIMVSNILGMLAGEYTVNRILKSYPELSRLDIISALEYASSIVDRGKMVA